MRNDVLILSRYLDINHGLESLARRLNYRARSAVTRDDAMRWIEAREFGVMLVHAEESVELQQELAGRLWERDLTAPFVVFDYDRSKHGDHATIRLFGAETAFGPQADQAIETILRSYQKSAEPSEQQRKILVVEDLDSPRDIICIFVEGLSISEVVGVASATEALAILEAAPKDYCCIITDFKMPGMTGAEMITALRAHKDLAHIPALVLTAFGTPDCLLECLVAGASGFLVKPPKLRDLERELGRALRMYSLGSDPRLAGKEELDAIKDHLIARGVAM